MKIQSPLRFALAAALFTVGIAATFTAAAQAGGTNPPVPVVNIYATDASASEAGGGTNTGRFTVYRDGPTNAPLTVYYTVGGSAQNGRCDRPYRYRRPTTEEMGKPATST